MKTISISLKSILLTLLFIFITPSFAATPQPVADTVITAKVKSKLAMDANLSGLNVDVSTNNGVVTLSGMVNSDTEASALIELVQSTDGVKNINDDNLKVKDSTQPFADLAITAKVKGMFIREKLTGKDIPAISISVETTNGVVYLSGTVSNQAQIDNAISIAKTISGVKNVESTIKIETSNNTSDSNNKMNNGTMTTY